MITQVFIGWFDLHHHITVGEILEKSETFIMLVKYKVVELFWKIAWQVKKNLHQVI